MSDDDVFPLFVTRTELMLLYWSLPEGCNAGRSLLAREWFRATAETVPPNPYEGLEAS